MQSREGACRVLCEAQQIFFFFGCNASTKEKPCKGSQEWQSVDVPDALRVVPDWAKQNTVVVKKDSLRKA